MILLLTALSIITNSYLRWPLIENKLNLSNEYGLRQIIHLWFDYPPKSLYSKCMHFTLLWWNDGNATEVWRLKRVIWCVAGMIQINYFTHDSHTCDKYKTFNYIIKYILCFIILLGRPVNCYNVCCGNQKYYVICMY